VLNKHAEASPEKAYEMVKRAYEKEKGLVWLKPVGLVNANGGTKKTYVAPVLRYEIFSDFPALPRVVDKLEGVLNDEIYTRMTRSVESGEKPRKLRETFSNQRNLYEPACCKRRIRYCLRDNSQSFCLRAFALFLSPVPLLKKEILIRP